MNELKVVKGENNLLFQGITNMEELKTFALEKVDEYKDIIVTENNYKNCEETIKEITPYRKEVKSYRAAVNKELTKKFIEYLLNMWYMIQPFKSKEEQQKCELRYCSRDKLKEFELLNIYGEYTVEFIACILELIMIQEKTGLATAFMFKGVLEAIYKEKDIFSIVAQARYNGRK